MLTKSNLHICKLIINASNTCSEILPVLGILVNNASIVLEKVAILGHKSFKTLNFLNFCHFLISYFHEISCTRYE